jgi:hypothetical protein
VAPSAKPPAPANNIVPNAGPDGAILFSAAHLRDPKLKEAALAKIKAGSDVAQQSGFKSKGKAK